MNASAARMRLLQKLLLQQDRVPSKHVPIPRRGMDGPCPLSFAQQRCWFIDQLEGASPQYNRPAALSVEGRLEVGVLQGVLGEVVRRHESLRTSFVQVDGVPQQRIEPSCRFSLPVMDLGGLAATRGRQVAASLASGEASRPFVLAAGGLLRSAVIRL